MHNDIKLQIHGDELARVRGGNAITAIGRWALYGGLVSLPIVAVASTPNDKLSIGSVGVSLGGTVGFARHLLKTVLR